MTTNEVNTFLADRSHNEDLCALMRRLSMPGKIELVYGRDPDFFHGLDTQGKFHQIGVTYLGSRLAGMGCRSIKPMYLHGEPINFGYLSSLRGDHSAAKGVTGEIFRLLSKVHQDEKTKAYLTTVISGNSGAMQAMVQAKSPFMPKFQDLGLYHVYSLLLCRKRHPHKRAHHLTIARGDQVGIARIVDYLKKEAPRRQFYPSYEESDFESAYTRDFAVKNFYVALDGHGEIRGVAAVWDQGAYKQHVVSGYHGLLKYTRSHVNLLLKATGYSPLPRTNDSFRTLYLSFVCVSNDDKLVFSNILDQIYQDYKHSGYNFIFCGFHERDPLFDVVLAYRHVTYSSRLFLVYWQDGVECLQRILQDNRVPYLELATL